MARVISVNVGLPRQMESDGKTVETGIFKAPVAGQIRVNRLNLEGDGQADLDAHGGPWKAVYAYPVEHYDHWHHELPGTELPWGAFGENLTIEGLLENEVHVGDQLQIGTAVLVVTQPRIPCYKLGFRLGMEDMPRRFLESGRTGFYLSVLKEGELAGGDTIERVGAGDPRISVATLFEADLDRENCSTVLIGQILQLKALSPGWHRKFERRLEERRQATGPAN